MTLFLCGEYTSFPYCVSLMTHMQRCRVILAEVSFIVWKSANFTRALLASKILDAQYWLFKLRPHPDPTSRILYHLDRHRQSYVTDSLDKKGNSYAIKLDWTICLLQKGFLMISIVKLLSHKIDSITRC